MITLIKQYVMAYVIHGIYTCGIFVSFASIFKKAEWGLFLFVSLVSLPNVWYKFASLPLGNEILDIIFVSVLMGIFINKRPVDKTGNLVLVTLFLFCSYLGLWNSTYHFSLPSAFSTENTVLKIWKNYAMMICLYFLTLNAIKKERDIKTLVLLITLVLFIISIRSIKNFTPGISFIDESRSSGPFWIVGLGANHFGSFIAHYSAVILGLFLFEKNKKRKMFFLITILLCLQPLFFTYSRGAYAATFLVLIFFGILKKRTLIFIALILSIFWSSLLPTSVVERIEMTKNEETGELESSVLARFELWEKAFNLYKQNPVFGIGWYGYVLSTDGERWRDPHNYYLKKLCEEGIIGLFLLLAVYLAALRSGWRLYKHGHSPFSVGIGFGFIGCVIASITTNLFGDRFSYYELGSFFWVFWGLVDRTFFISMEYLQNSEAEKKRIISNLS